MPDPEASLTTQKNLPYSKWTMGLILTVAKKVTFVKMFLEFGSVLPLHQRLNRIHLTSQ